MTDCECYCYTNYNNYDNYVMEIEDFLSSDECDGIIDFLKSKEDEYFTSKIWRGGKDVLDLNDRVCKQRWCNVDEFVLFRKIKMQAKKYFGDLPDETLLSLHYKPGGFFKEHYDAGKGLCDHSGTQIGNRKWTIITYLNDDYDGGGTYFPMIDRLVTPKKGKALCFLNTSDDMKVIRESIHLGKDVTNGEKWIINQWLYHDDFEF